MDTQDEERLEYFLQPGHIYVSGQNVVIRTVLGTCVSVLLWDRKQLFGGGTHFVFPMTKDREKATARFGNVALIALWKMMEERGALIENIDAHIVGGAVRSDKIYEGSKAEENVEVARRFIKKKSLKLASEDVGGHFGKKVGFDVMTGKLIVLKVRDIRQSDWHE